ncbi:hypothetical protein P9858_20070 [Niallia circulans]|uniref:hypothetical protein n=1 Tax=Niallia circulans TaxID=1397 RepID=UPI002E237EE7|nr:hypothetical protein [Niallia circulans]
MYKYPIEKMTPRTGRMILEDGSIVNIADLLKMSYNGRKIIETRLVASIPYTAIVNSQYTFYPNVLTPNASKRIFTLINNTDQNTAAVKATVYDSKTLTISGKSETSFQDNAGNNNMDNIIGTGLHRGKWAVVGSDYPNDTNSGNTNVLSNCGDGLIILTSVPTILPTTGTLDIYCQEIM